MKNDIKQDRVVNVKMNSFVRKPKSDGLEQQQQTSSSKEASAADTERRMSHCGGGMSTGHATTHGGKDGNLSKGFHDNVLPVSNLPPISPAHCIVRGLSASELANGVRVKSTHEFSLEACSADGTRSPEGGGAFFAAIRGTARVRARITDNEDGTYKIAWTPPLSGDYTIALSLFGVSLPGSPFTVTVHGNEPYAPNCEVRGDALFNISTRATAAFEIRYRDRTGGVARPEELDVFVVADATFVVPDALLLAGGGLPGSPPAAPQRPPCPWEAATGGTRDESGLSRRLSSVRTRASGAPAVVNKEEDAATADKGEDAATANKGEDAATADKEEDAATAGTAAADTTAAKPTRAKFAADTLSDDEAAAAAATTTKRDASGRRQRVRAGRVRVGDRPLIVRAEADLTSEQVALLGPGRLVNVVE